MESVEQLKFVPVENGTTLSDIHGKCPKCGFDFKGPDVKEHLLSEMRTMPHFDGMSDEELNTQAIQIAKNYGWTEEEPRSFSLIIGVELPGAVNGVVLHQCPGCESTWDRHSHREGTYEIALEELPESPQAEPPVEEQVNE